MNFLKEYLSPLLKWWWLIITAPLIAAASAFWFARQLPPVYQARTTLLIGRAIQDPNPSSTEFNLSYQLAREYADMTMREPVQNAVKNALGLTVLPEYEATARGIFLEIAVIHTDPKFAQVVANVIAEQLIFMSPVNTSKTSAEDQQFVMSQLKELQTSIEQTNRDLNSKQSLLLTLESALDIAKTQVEIRALEEKLSSLQSIYANLFSSTREAAFNTLSVFDAATEPKLPIGPKKVLIVVLAALSGLIFAAVAAYLIEFMDDTIKNTDEISRITDVPVIGVIAEIQGFKPTISADQPRSPIADAFRGLRTNIDFAGVDRSMRKVVISSAEASDGKSTIAMNLAIVMAQAEKKVILVDADLRSPSIHRYLGMPENPGLSDVFLDRISIKDALVEWTGTPKFKVLPAGTTPPNSAELLGSRKMDQILEELAGMADYILVDGPPGFVVDAVVLSAKADGVLLVINIGETRRGPVKAVVEQFERLGTNLIGVVLNRVARSSSYYGSYYYSSYYSKEPATRPVKSTSKRLWKARFMKFVPAFFSNLRKKGETQSHARIQPVNEKAVNFINRVKRSLPAKTGNSKTIEKEIPKSIPLPRGASDINQDMGMGQSLKADSKIAAPDLNSEVVEPVSAQTVQVVQDLEPLSSEEGSKVDLTLNGKTGAMAQKKVNTPAPRARKVSVRKKTNSVKSG